MSSLIVEVCQVDEVIPHPNADKMAVARIKGWYVCVAKNAETGEPWVKAGDKVVYFPPDAVIPGPVADKHGVTKYLGHLPRREDGTRPEGGRVQVANLRGFKSYGYLAEPDDPTWEVGKDVADYYGVTKYEPPLRANQGDAERPHPAFHRYYDMENIRNFPSSVFVDGEEVVCTEKIHGENCRLGLIRDTNDKGEAVWKWVAGTHDVRRKRFWQKQDKEGKSYGPVIESAPWQCFNPAVRAMLCDLSGCGYTPEEVDAEPLVKGNGNNVVVFGERFGSGIQDMWYGHENGKFSFRAFDVTVNGKYLDFDVKVQAFSKHAVEMVPVVWRGPFSFAQVEELAEGPTLVCTPKGKKDFREGVVVLAVKERQVVTDKKVMERAQLKCVSFTYLNRKEGTEFH